jgi:drug/metabolite transporter (DMT)-like permease
MNSLDIPVLYALGANLFFSSASLVFATFSRKHSSLWMNAFKASVAFLTLIVIVPLFGSFNPISLEALVWLMLSGLIGLAIGDVCLFRAYSLIGAGRTLMLFGFQPLLLGSMGYVLFGQLVEAQRFLGIFFFVACLLIFSLESRRMRGHWEWKGLMWALIGVFFDAGGVLLTRGAFESSPALTSLEANLYRFAGALIGFVLIAKFFRPIRLIERFRSESSKNKSLLIFASLCGTTLSLGLYLVAIQTGHLATVSAIAITSPLFATLLECLVARKWPSIYLWVALLSFACGFWITLEI